MRHLPISDMRWNSFSTPSKYHIRVLNIGTSDMFRLGLLLNLWLPVKFTPFSVDVVVESNEPGLQPANFG